ncbi:hypothetical protein E6C27_scaffold274G005980 [Cucumis melo var. makuwa]|uniref:Uncharacterized protein n=2 Tax=Cucumis melo TaxID=3656 RepID=A0A5A7UQX0_CUCMM|nr:hypothetical protein E6C27_scaffold274G005980 [Cucumis melo var. makuwa]
MAAKDHTLHRLSEKPFSLLQANQFFVHKILSRNSSFGRSARLPACGLPGQIPFNWETQPGLPKNQPSETPPPAELPPPSSSAFGLSKTPHVVPKQAPVKIWFWNKQRRKSRRAVKKNGALGSSSSPRRHVDRESEFCRRKSNDESPSSSSLSCISYSLSSNSSSASSSDRYNNRRRSKLGSLAKEFIRWAF